MTLPKGYKPGTPSRDYDDNNYRPTRRKGGNWKKAIVSLIMFIISLSFFLYFLGQYIEEGKELDELKKIVQQTKKDYEKAFYDVYGRYPSYPSEYPPKTPP